MTYNYTLEVNSFYERLSEADFNLLDSKKIVKLKISALELNKFYNNKFDDMCRFEKYIKIMNKIKTNPKHYNVESLAERYILFMFSVDPTFEAIKIYGECNKINEVKNKSTQFFGLYDKRLISLEKFFVKNFLSSEMKKRIDKEIEERVYKI